MLTPLCLDKEADRELSPLHRSHTVHEMHHCLAQDKKILDKAFTELRIQIRIYKYESLHLTYVTICDLMDHM